MRTQTETRTQAWTRAENRAFRYDYVLLAAVILLTLLGLVTLSSASHLFALNRPARFADGLAPLRSNVMACMIMLLFFPLVVFSRLNMLRDGKVIFALVAFTVFLNILPFLPAFQRGGSDQGLVVKRWIILRIAGGAFSFQPSEAIKVVLPLYLAFILDKNSGRIGSFFYGPLPPAIVTAVFAALAYFQDNYSEVVLIAVVGIVVCFIAGIRYGWFVLSAGVVGGFLYMVTFGNPDGRWYRRISTFLNPGQDRLGATFQTDMSREAIRSGGFTGSGIGQGTVKTRIPEVHGDFVFASFAEETGLLGVFMHLALIGVFAGIVFYVVWQSGNRFRRLLAFGLVTPIVLQTLLNVAVVANVIPTTGVALPFVSSGGSSLLMTLLASAILVNIARRHVLSLDREVPDAG